MKRLALALLAGAAFVPTAAYAQPAAADSEPASLEREPARREQEGEIVVTAQRFEQRLQDVPLSLTVVGSEELEARSVTDITDMQYAVPGLSIYQTGIGRSAIQLRGVSTSNGASTVGVYFDELPISLDAAGDHFNIRLLDLERIEVLRGPQATLYGQGSMGGTIRYIPAAPRFDGVSGSFEGQYSSIEDGGSGYRAVGVLNLPLSDAVAIRLVGGYERIGGYIDNVVSDEADTNHADILTLRGTLLARPTDRLTFSLIGLHQESNVANQEVGINRQTSVLVDQPVDDRYTLVQARASYDFDFAELSGTFGYIDRRNVAGFDVSPGFVPLLGLLGFPPGFITSVGLTATTNYELRTGELRLSSQDPGAVTWQVGAIYRDLKVYQFGGTFTSPGALPFPLIQSDDVSRNRSFAIYGEGSYAFTPQLTLTAGLRYFHENKQRTVTATNLGVVSTDVGDGDFETLNPRFNLSYEITPNSLIFVNAAKGFRSGGFNQTSAGGGIVPVPPTYEPDAIWTYELGTRHQLLGNRLMVEASVYYSDWSNVQSNNFAPGGVVLIINNSGNVSGWGVDLAAIARLTDTLTLSATYGWNDLSFQEATADKAPGDPVDNAIQESWSASLDFRPRLSDRVTGIFRIDYQHAGQGQNTLRNQPIQFNIFPARDLVNLRAGAEFGPVEISVFATNLFDEDTPLLLGPTVLTAENIEQRPRTIGIQANFRF